MPTRTMSGGRASASDRADAPVRVLHTAGDRAGGNLRYVDQVHEGGAAAGIESLFFSWPRALLGSYDVLHVHWPESLVRHRRAAGALVKRLLMRAVLLRLAVRGTPLVRTVHNEEPHEPGARGERRVLAAIDRRTTLRIVLNPATRVPAGARSVDIPHGHFRDRFHVDPAWESRPGRLLQVGRIRPYKGTERLLDVFSAVPDPALTLRIVGNPLDAGIAATVRRAAAADPRISHRLEFVGDDDLVREVRAAELVVLAYTIFHNSGVALLALSLDRPVLMPRSGSSEALRREVGADWVHLFDGPLTGADVERAVAAARSGRSTTVPDLRDRDWDRVGRRHRAAYLTALGRLS